MIGVYILANENRTLYCGMTNNLVRRILEHKQAKISRFAKKYNLKKCVYFEFCDTIRNAIIREKQIKNLSRAKKLDLVESKNALWADLSGDLFSFVEDPSSVAIWEPIPDKPE